MESSWLSKSLFTISEVAITPVGIAKFLILLLCFFSLAKFLQKSIQTYGKKLVGAKDPSLYVLSRVVYYFLLVLGVVFAIGGLGFDLTVFAFVTGALAVWIGVGLKGIFHNFFCGVVVLLSKTVRKNDVIQLSSGEVGQVSDINLFATVLTTLTGEEIVLPNPELVGKKYTNRTLTNTIHRLVIPFAIPLDLDKKKTRNTILEEVQKIPSTLAKPQPEIWTHGYTSVLGKQALDCTLSIWVDEKEGPKYDAPTKALYFDLIDDLLRDH